MVKTITNHPKVITINIGVINHSQVGGLWLFSPHYSSMIPPRSTHPRAISAGHPRRCPILLLPRPAGWSHCCCQRRQTTRLALESLSLFLDLETWMLRTKLCQVPIVFQSAVQKMGTQWNSIRWFAGPHCGLTGILILLAASNPRRNGKSCSATT